MAIARSGATVGSDGSMRCASAGWPERDCQLARICASRRFGSVISVSAGAIQPSGLIRTVAEVGDHRGMQREDATKARVLDIGSQCGQRGIGASVALL